jgi:thermitase
MKLNLWFKHATKALLAVGVCVPLWAQALPPVQPQADGPSYRAGELIVQFNDDVNDAQIDDAFQKGALKFLKHVQTHAMKDHGQIGLTLASTTLPVEQAIQAVQHLPGVKFAQPNWVYTHQTTSSFSFDDPFFGSLWGMGDGFGSSASQSWNAGFTGSKSVYVGVIDEGIQFDHPDLAANIWTNPDEIPGNGIDEDGAPNDPQPYIDDIHGWNALDNNGNIYDAANDDHGTHVSGTIGGIGANGIGVAGVNWNVSIISGKFLGPSGGSTLDAIEAIDYMTMLKTKKHINLVALNNSWGGGGFDQALLDAITRAANADILFVVAAGNGNRLGVAVNNDNTPSYPSSYNTTSGAGYDSVIAVTAIAKDGTKATWANYGATSVDLGAPGVGILSTTPGGTYSQMDGTSMATPHVTGAIALYAATHPGATAAQIKDALLKSTTPTASLSGKTVTGGRLNVPNFLNTPAAPVADSTAPLAPGAPVAPTVAATPVSSREIDLAWTDNSDNETGFQIQRSTDGTTWAPVAIVAAGRTTYADVHLAGSTTYTYSIAAYNSAGTSQGFVSSATTPVAPPPPSVSFVSKDTTTKGNWIGKYGADGYNVILDSANYPTYATVTAGGYSEWLWAGSTTDTRGLQKFATPTDRIAACWYSGASFDIDVNFTDGAVHTVALYCVDWETTTRAFRMDIVDPATDAVLATQNVTAYNGGQYLVWNVGGHAIIRSTMTGGKNATVSGIFFDTPPPAPSAPSALGATATSSSQINLTWTDNSANETGFKIERSSDGTTFSQIATAGANTSSFSDADLTASTTYSYRVRAYNATGDSSYSEVVTAQTLAPPPVPGAPTTLSASAISKNQINLAWTAGSAGGQTGFKIERTTDINNTPFAQIAVVGPTTKSYSNTGLKSNTTYYYRVRAYNSSGDGAYSVIASAKTPLH